MGELLRPKIVDNATPSSLKDFNFPTADESRAVPVVFGTVNMDGPNVIWYGDLKTVKLTKKVKTGLFSSQRLTLGFRYSIGMQFSLCHGPIDALLEVRTKDKVAFTGNVTASSGEDGENFVVDARTIYGGDSEEQLQASGTGGVYAACTLYKGSGTQNASSYLATVLGTAVPAHRGIAHIVWKGPTSGNLVYNYDLGDPTIAFTREPFLSGYVGTSPNINPLSFVVKRLPNMLSGVNDTFYNINNGDANPADVIFEILINDEWGMGLSSGLIDVTSFKTAQTTIYNDGLGFSGIWDSPRQITEIIEEILKYIDGTLYVDLSTGLITLKLARNDYDVNNVMILDEDSVVEITDFSRGSWDETTNEVVVTYIDRFNKYKEKTATAHDLANSRIQDDVISARVTYAGVSNQAVAKKIAYRDLRQLTIPLARCSIKVNRKAYTLRPGSVFKLIWPDYDIESVIFRVVKIDYGQLENGMIGLEVVQDVFSLSNSIYGSSESEWVDSVTNADVITTFETVELPYFYGGDAQKVQVFAAQPDNELAFNTYTSGSISGTYVQSAIGDSFTPTGTLDDAISDITLDVVAGPIEINPSTPDNLNLLQNFAADFVRTGENLFLITDGTKFEVCAFESVTFSAGKYNLTNVWRGLLDTVPQSWSAGARVWFFSYSDAYTSQSFDNGSTVYTKLESVGARDKSALSAADLVTIDRRSLKPYPPGYFRINTSTSTVNISNGSNIVVDWTPRNRVTQGERVTKQFETGITAEARTEYYIKFFGEANVALRTVGPLTTTTYTYLNADQVADNAAVEPKIVTVQLYSKRDGLFSLYPQQRTLVRPTGVVPSPVAYSPGANSYSPPPDGDAVSLNGIRVCTNAPTNGQVLVYNSTNNCWEPSTLSVTLAGDVTGPSSSNTVVKLQNRDLASTAPTTNQFLGWNAATSKWEPRSIASGSSGSVAVTNYTDTAETLTANNTWTDISEMNLAYTPPELSTLFCTFTCEVSGITANNEHIAFRFVLNGATFSETWSMEKNTLPSNDQKYLVTLHATFEDVAANTSQAVKVQWHDNGSNLDVTFGDRRITMITCKSSYDINFDPLDLSGLQYWFKADALTGLANNDPVASMLDQSGNARHFPAFGTSSPDTRGIYKTNQLNGLPSLSFTHDGSALTTTNTRYDGPNFVSAFTEGEIFVVIKATADPATGNLVGAWATFGTDGNVTHYPFTDGTVYDGFATTARKNTGNPATNLSNFNLYNISSKANQWISRINGTVHFSTTTNAVAYTTAPYFGGNNGSGFGAGFSGDMCEIIYYNRVLNSSERAKVRTYITSKYGV